MQLLTPEWVTPKFDKAVKYRVRGMNGLEYNDFKKHPGELDEKGNLTVPTEGAEIALRAVSDWEGVTRAGKPVAFSYAALKDGADLQTLMFLLSAVLERTAADGNTEKN